MKKSSNFLEELKIKLRKDINISVRTAEERVLYCDLEPVINGIKCKLVRSEKQ